MTPSVQIVLVLYGHTLAESRAFNSFMRYRHLLSAHTFLLIYNNSPEIKVEPAHDGSYDIFNSTQNDMLAKAYNMALEYAGKNRCRWLMPLDQDTELSSKFLSELNAALSNKTTDSVAAILPIFMRDGVRLSPVFYHPALSSHWCRKPVSPGLNHACISAFNSCATIAIKAIKAIGGFPEEYPLDDLDMCYLYRFYRLGYTFLIIDAGLNQDLSILDYKKHMTAKRYNMILDADLRFAREIGMTAVIMWKLRMVLRCLKSLTNTDRRKYIPLTLSYIFK